MMEEVSKTVVINLTANTLLSVAMRLQKERNMSNEDLEMAVSKVLLDIKSATSLEYANRLVELTCKLNDLEKKSEENENGESV